ncbi:MAG: hypothetical protein GTO40_19355, partial [Deltaproteobacteria bacterium]|nr:hypothetical protein [Deltaproteobacteria bacterium]
AVVLIGGGFLLAGDQIRDLAGLAGDEETVPAESPTPEPTATTVPTPEESEDTTTTAEGDSGTADTADSDEEAPTADQEEAPASRGEPIIGEITFALG